MIGEGENVTISCIAKGYPLKNIIFDPWLFEPTFPSPSDNISHASRQIEENVITSPVGKVLHLTNVQPLDSGKYWCSAVNEMLLTRRRFIEIDVTFKPRLDSALSSPLIRSVRTGQAISLVASIQANPPPTDLEWVLLNGTNLRHDPVPVWWMTERLSPTISQLSIPSLSVDDLKEGPVKIAIRAVNGRGQSMFTFKLLARGPPSDPKDFKAIRSWPNTLMLSFQPGFDGGQPQMFQVTCQNKISNSSALTRARSVVIRDPGFGKIASVALTKLEPSTLYRCSVEGITHNTGSNESSSWRTNKVFTQAKTLSQPVVNFTKVEWNENGNFYLNNICFTVACNSHPKECNSELNSISSNLANMRVAAEITICQRKLRKNAQEKCWTSFNNHTLQISELHNRSTSENTTKMINGNNCFQTRAFNNFSSDDHFPRLNSSVAVTVRLYSIMDGEFVFGIDRVVFTAPELYRKGSKLLTNFYTGEDLDYSDEGVIEKIGVQYDYFWPLIGVIVGVVFVFAVIGLVASLACASARRARDRHRRMSPSGSLSGTQAYASSSSPTSSTDESHVKASVRNNITTSRDRLSSINFSTGSLSNCSKQAKQTATDFHWADFRANPVLSSVGVASGLAIAGAMKGTNVVRGRPGPVTCLSGSTSAVYSASLSKLISKQHSLEVSPTLKEVDDEDSSEEFQCIDGFNAQRQQRRHSTAVIDANKNTPTNKGILMTAEGISPPPGYTTLYSRLVDLKTPSDRANNGRTMVVAPTEYAKLDFVRMGKLSNSTSAVVLDTTKHNGRHQIRTTSAKQVKRHQSGSSNEISSAH